MEYIKNYYTEEDEEKEIFETWTTKLHSCDDCVAPLEVRKHGQCFHLFGSPDNPFDEPSRGYINLEYLEGAEKRRSFARNIMLSVKCHNGCSMERLLSLIVRTKTDKQCIYNWLERESSTDKSDDCSRKDKDNIDVDSVDSIVYSVLKKFTQRAKVGKDKYKTDLDRTDLNILDWVKHTQEELMDATLYLEKLKKEFEIIDKNKK